MCVREELRENFHTLLREAYFFTINIIIIIIIVIFVIVPSKARWKGIYNFVVRNVAQNDEWIERGS